MSLLVFYAIEMIGAVSVSDQLHGQLPELPTDGFPRGMGEPAKAAEVAGEECDNAVGGKLEKKAQRSKMKKKKKQVHVELVYPY